MSTQIYLKNQSAPELNQLRSGARVFLRSMFEPHFTWLLSDSGIIGSADIQLEFFS